MFKYVVLLCLLSVVLVYSRPADKYTTKYDNIDLDEILKSDRIIKNYFNCLMTGRGCTPDGLELKKNLPDALKNNCMKCSEKQKEGSKKIIQFMIENKKHLWEKIEKKYDPSGSYKKKYEAELKKIKSKN
ncbi:ejaculatory bulb-specific protein 3-like [Harmonia axyridis]|uniref:ejaculatory bulb-specific protein 3-like n=1 Tax=Harmonia axyridis TaxID=115357 RepID=UPI001E27508C|nr:ejaculatory bulb-specific protein 3-like [Harmonia axyridis]